MGDFKKWVLNWYLQPIDLDLGQEGDILHSNSYKALLALAAAAVGFLLSYPYQYSFWGGLLYSGFAAAMVGGLADWYAVTALFRQPFSLSNKPGIIPKNRERIFKAIVTMVEDDIITAATIKETLTKAGMVRLLFDYVSRVEARQQLYTVVGNLARESASTMKAVKLSTALQLLLTANKDKIKIAPLAGQTLEWAVKSGFADKVIDLVISELKRMVGEKYMLTFIATIYSRALSAYSDRQNQRKLVSWVMENLLNIDPLTVAASIRDKIVVSLDELYHINHPIRQRLLAWVSQFAERLTRDPALSAKAEAELGPLVSVLAERLAEVPLSQPEMIAGGTKWAVKRVVKLADEFVEDPVRQAKIDAYLTDKLAEWVSQNHSEIGRIVTEYLERFSNEELVTYIEDKVKNDLQMIRINGTVVGGFVGMILFLITCLAGVRT